MNVKSQVRTRANPGPQTLPDAPARPEQNRRAVRVFLAALILACGMLAAFWWRNAGLYGRAEEALASGNFDEAYRLYSRLGHHSDASEQIGALLEADPTLPFRFAKKGDVVTFGHYEQDNDLSDGPEPVEWLVLDRIGDEVLLLSLYGLDSRQYHEAAFADVTWEICSLRRWLNGEFFDSCFSEREQSVLMLSSLQNADQSALGTEGGSATRDRVFLLSETEAVIYFSEDANRKAVGQTLATEYARLQGAPAGGSGFTEWWLRSPGADRYTAQFVTAEGETYVPGAYVDLAFAVRPAVWLNTARPGG